MKQDYTVYPRHPQMGPWLVSQGKGMAEDPLGTGESLWLGWDERRDGGREQVEASVEAWAATYRQQLEAAQQAHNTRRATLRALRDGAGNLTAAQLTSALRVLAREVLGED